MWKSSKQISVSKASILDLKSEIEKSRKDAEQKIAKKLDEPELKRSRKNKSSIAVKDQAAKSDFISSKKKYLPNSSLKSKAELYEKLSQGKLDEHIEREILSNENILVDFERKNLEKHDLFNDEDLVEIEDEFGRTIRLPRKKAGMASNFHENTSSDIKEYKPHETTGYHMFPPIEQLSYAQRVQEKQKRDFEAKTEWQDILFSQNEYFDSKKAYREMGVSHYVLSTDTNERQEQLNELNELRKQTANKQAELKQKQTKRASRLQAKMQKIKKRKRELLSLLSHHEQSTSSGSTHELEEEAEEFLSKII